ncbi:hypothetical protein CALVIDRAFT_32854 [Calocera viscosa TUFC12733]|uniref:Uncharacterized protein n=1 Tax=Calocera viscosa (strain TUFC12733) TaxID=1330018 RepID=A0A167FRA3_CALVF|nr:hypothetical protein CALVIDRAFT_32854 [Calocera viscosa TUFC12733]
MVDMFSSTRLTPNSVVPNALSGGYTMNSQPPARASPASPRKETNICGMLRTIDPKTGASTAINIVLSNPVLVGSGAGSDYCMESSAIETKHCIIYAVKHDDRTTICCEVSVYPILAVDRRRSLGLCPT